MNSSQKKAFFISLSLAIWMCAVACYLLFVPKPSITAYEPWIPSTARVLNAQNVKTGTFRVDISREEMKRKVSESGETPLVVISDKGFGPDFYPKVEYWLPGKGGIFDYFVDYVPIDKVLFNSSVVFDSVRGVFNISIGRSWGLFGIALFVCLVSSLVAWRAFTMEIFKADTD